MEPSGVNSVQGSHPFDQGGKEDSPSTSKRRSEILPEDITGILPKEETSVPMHPKFQATVIKESSRLRRMAFKLLQFAGKFFSAAQLKAQNMVVNQENRVKKVHDSRINLSEEQKAAHLAFAKKEEFSVSDTLKLPVELRMDVKSLEAKSLGHKTAAMIAAGKVEIPPVEEMAIPGMSERLVAYSHKAREGNPLGKNYVTPSNQLEGKEGGPLHLFNNYAVVIEGKNYGVIRSGMITTKQYADDFVNCVKEIVKQLPEELKGKPVRVVSQQLNSQENESRIINAQHRWMVYANQQLKLNGGEVVHINIPSNRWYSYTKKVEGLGPLGKFLTSKVFKGERLSREMNLDSWGTYVEWTRQALQEIPQGKKAFPVPNYRANQLKQEIDNLIEKTYGLKLSLDDGVLTKEDRLSVKSELKGLNQKLKMKRQEMRGVLENEYINLSSFVEMSQHLLDEIGIGKLKDETGVLKRALEGAKLMQQVLGVQLQMPGCSMSRGKEGMLIQLLNDRLGVHSGLNCKSGLDRTGFWHAVKIAMVRFEKENPNDDMVEFIADWDKNSALVNKVEERLNKTGSSIEEWLNEKQSDDWISLAGDLFPKGSIKWSEGKSSIDPGLLIYLKSKIQQVTKFRKIVLQNMISTGIPITQISTGLVGFKWNSGFTENLHPLNFIPARVSFEGDTKISHPLVNYTKNGSVKGITPWGRSLLTKFHNLRGS